MFSARRHGHGFSRQPGPKGTGGERKAPCIASLKDNFAVRNSPRRELGLAVPRGALLFRLAIRRGCRGASGKPPCWHDKRQLCRKQIPLVGPDAPTPAREKGLQPYGALTLFFRWRKKSVQKKASGTATPGKSPLLPILAAGLAMSRAAWLASLRLPSCALGARLFSAVKMGGPFSLRCLSPLCSGAVGGGQAYPLQVEMLRCSRKVLRRG